MTFFVPYVAFIVEVLPERVSPGIEADQVCYLVTVLSPSLSRKERTALNPYYNQ